MDQGNQPDEANPAPSEKPGVEQAPGPLDRPLPLRIGRYTPLKRLGLGGMAEIFLAEREGPAGFRKKVVVKRILPALLAEPRFVDLFLREARLAALLNHTNIVQIYELGEEQGSYYIAMEYIDGASLHQIAGICWRRGFSLPQEMILATIADAALGLHFAHQLKQADGSPAGLLHRDVSPDNLMVNREGVTKVLDFGVATGGGAINRVGTQVGELKGKIAFMAPEQIRGETPCDGRADLYGLGVCLFWLLTGHRPHKGTSDVQTLESVINRQPPRPRDLNPMIPQPLEDLVLSLLDKDPDRRPTSGAHLYDILFNMHPMHRHDIAEFVGSVLSWQAQDRVGMEQVSAAGFVPSSPSYRCLSKATGEEEQGYSLILQREEEPAAEEDVSQPEEEETRFLASQRLLPPAVWIGVGAAIFTTLLGLGLWGLTSEETTAEVPLVEAPAPAPDQPGPAQDEATHATDPDTALATPTMEALEANLELGQDDPPVPELAPPAPARATPEELDDESPAPATGRSVESVTQSITVRAPSRIRWTTLRGRLIGRGSTRLRLPAGARQILAQDPRRSSSVKVQVTSNRINYRQLPRGKLSVRAYPYAEVYLGKEKLGTTPFPAINVVAGRYVVVLKHEGKTRRIETMVLPDQTNQMKIDMTTP